MREQYSTTPKVDVARSTLLDSVAERFHLSYDVFQTVSFNSYFQVWVKIKIEFLKSECFYYFLILFCIFFLPNLCEITISNLFFKSFLSQQRQIIDWSIH